MFSRVNKALENKELIRKKRTENQSRAVKNKKHGMHFIELNYVIANI